MRIANCELPIVGSARVGVSLNLESLRRDGARAREVIATTVGTQAQVAVRANVEGMRDIKRLQELINQVETTAGTARLSVQVSGRNELVEVRRLAEDVLERSGGRVQIDIDVTQANNRLLEFRRNVSTQVTQGILKGIIGVEGVEALGVGIGQNIGAGISRAVQQTVGAVIEGATSLVKSSLGKSLSFSSQIRSFAALSDIDPNSTEALGVRKEIERLGSGVTTKKASEIAKGAIELTKLGFSAKDVKKELAGLVSLAESTGESLGTSASIVGATSNVYQTSAQRISDVVAATANATAADANDFLQAVSKAGGVAKSNNQSLETLAATFGLIRNAGFSAESAATGVKTAINRLSAPTGEKQKNAIAEIGVQIRDSSGEMRNFLSLVPEFRKALENFSPADKARLVKTIFGDEGGPVFLGLLSTTQEKIDSVYKTVVNSGGRAAETSQKLVGGLSGAVTKFQSAAELIQIKFGDAISPIAEAVVNLGNRVATGLLAREGLFDGVAASAKKFGDELNNNEELAQSLEQALDESFNQLAETGIDLIKQFTETLRENPKILSEAVITMGQFISLIGQGIKLAVNLGDKLARASTELQIYNSPGAADGEGARKSLMGQGATREDINRFNTELSKELEENRLPDHRDSLSFQGEKDRFDRVLNKVTTKYSDELLKRSKLKKYAEEAKATDAVNLANAEAPPNYTPIPVPKDPPKAKPKPTQLNAKEAEKAKKLELQKEALIERQAQANIKSSESRATANIKQQQLAGKLDSSDAAVELEKVRNNTNTKELSAAQSQLSRLNTLRKKGVIDGQKFATEEAQIKQKIAGLQTQSIDGRLRLKEVTSSQALNKEQLTENKIQSGIRSQEARANIQTKQDFASKKITAEEAEKQFANTGVQTADSQLKAAQNQLTRLRQLKQQGVLDSKKFGEQEIQINDRINSIKIQKLDAEQKARDISNKQTIENLERANKQAEAAINRSTSARILEVRRGVLEGKKSEEQAAKEIAEIKSLSSNKEVALIQKKLTDIDSLVKAGVLTEKQAADQKLQLQQQLASKNQELVEQQIENQKRLRDEAIKAIEDQITAERRRSDEYINNLQNELKRTIEFQQKRDDIQRGLLESRASLVEAQASAQATRVGIGVSQADKALQARRELNNKDISPAQKGALEAELNSLGFSAGQSELDILKEKQARENELAKTKLEALTRQQELTKKLQEFELKRMEFAQRVAEYEARIAISKAKQVEIEARGNLAKAQQLAPGRERDNAIASANDQIKFASEGVKLAEENQDIIKEQSKATQEIIQNKRQELQFNQQSQRDAFNAEELSRVNNQRSERAKLGDSSFTPNASFSKGAVGSNGAFSSTGNESKPIPLRDQLNLQPDGANSFLKKNIDKAQPNIDVGRVNPGEKLNSVSLDAISGAMTKLQETNNQSLIQSVTSSIAPIITQLQTLGAQIVAAASKPTEINVSGSPNPGADAVDIYSNIMRNNVAASNM